MSLRTRLIGSLLALTAAGLLVLAAVTYTSQRSFQLHRVDEQTSSAQAALGHQLSDAGFPAPGGGASGPAHRPDGATTNLPPGTYAQRRDATGKVLGATAVSFGDASELPAPKLPSSLHAGQTLTVAAKSGDGQYRVRVFADNDGAGVLVVAVPLDGVHATLARLALTEGLVIVGVLFLLGGVAFVLVRAEMRPLERISETAGAIAAGDLSQRIENTSLRTEVGRVGLALNEMLDRLEVAFADRAATEERLRRFLSDASHELRTPLSSIRGYAELHRMGAGDPDVSMRRIEDEAARMGTLVEDLLTLARLDELDERAPEPVDLQVLVEDAAADARATAADRLISAHTGADVVVLGDRDQLRQVLANLTRNALVHTPAGTPLALDVTRVGDEIVIAVRDFGPGLPTTDPDELFGRFWRAEKGRTRGRAGAGLGLSIVAAIVAAHGGRAHAENAPGGGARFTITLPAANLRVGAAERPLAALS